MPCRAIKAFFSLRKEPRKTSPSPRSTPVEWWSSYRNRGEDASAVERCDADCSFLLLSRFCCRWTTARRIARSNASRCYEQRQVICYKSIHVESPSLCAGAPPGFKDAGSVTKPLPTPKPKTKPKADHEVPEAPTTTVCLPAVHPVLPAACASTAESPA